MSPKAHENPRTDSGSAGPQGFISRQFEALKGYCTERLGLEEIQALAAHKQVPIHRTSVFYFLGGMALFLFVIQVITGILLSLYYKASPDQAFESVRAIMTEIDYGWLIRSIHSWSANLLVGVLLLHVLTTFLMRAYRRPREATWVTGLFLLGIFFAFGFSGYLLPWNQLAFFATAVGTKIMGAVPVIGKQMLLVARSGENVTGDTLARFYSLHVVILPLVTLGLLAVHLYLVQKHGMSIPENAARRRGGAKNVPSMPFIPHFLLRDMVGWYIALGLLAALAAMFPWELGRKANPFGSAPEGIKPEWYFLFMFETLKQLPPKILGIEGEIVGVLFFGFAGLIVLAIPLLDWQAQRGGPRRILNFLAAVVVFFFVLQTISGMDLVKFQLLQSAMLSVAASIVFWVLVLGFYRLGGEGRRPTTLLCWFLLLGLLASATVVTAADVPVFLPPPPPPSAEAKKPSAAKPEAKESATPAKAPTAPGTPPVLPPPPPVQVEGKTPAKAPTVPGTSPVLPPPPPVQTGGTTPAKTPPVPEKPPVLPPPPPPAVKMPAKEAAGPKLPEPPKISQSPKKAEPLAAKAGEKAGEELAAKPNNCLLCHGNKDVWEGDQLRLYVTEKDFHSDVHWGRGLRCANCHGGNPATEQVNEAHAQEDGFRSLRLIRSDGTKDFRKPPDRAKVVELCGECHANIQFMKDFNPSPRVDQLREYWTSGHGQRIKESGDPNVATCVSCHDQPHGTGRDPGPHGVLAVKSLDSPVYVKNVAKTCAKCHSDAKLMANYKYHGRPIGHSQYDEWRESVHGKTLLDKSDLSAPACNRCHGNHGALPPQVNSVANACGTCHGKIAGLFNKTAMRHAFEQVGLPGCATCHSNHKILSPSDQMLGDRSPEVCSRCHADGASKGPNAAILAGFDMKRILHGGEVAKTLRNDLEGLKQQIAEADASLENAARLGMLVPGPQSNPRLDPRLYLRKASDALTNARVEIHTFDAVPVEKIINGGQTVAAEVQASAGKAMEDYRFRRIWLAGSLAPIGLVVFLLVLFIRRMPIPKKEDPPE